MSWVSPTVLHSDRLPLYLKKLVKLDRCCMVRVCPQVGCGIDDVYQMPNRSTAKMRAISRMPAAVFVTWIENKLHSHSPKGITSNYQKMPLKRNGNFANFTVAELNSYFRRARLGCPFGLGLQFFRRSPRRCQSGFLPRIGQAWLLQSQLEGMDP